MPFEGRISRHPKIAPARIRPNPTLPFRQLSAVRIYDVDDLVLLALFELDLLVHSDAVGSDVRGGLAVLAPFEQDLLVHSDAAGADNFRFVIFVSFVLYRLYGANSVQILNIPPYPQTHESATLD